MGLQGLAAINRNDVWAVGVKATESGQGETITEHWDGTTWSVFPSPSPGDHAYLLAAAGSSSHDVWAVGLTNTGSVVVPLIEHWNGTTWSVVPSPSPSDHAFLSAVAAGPNGEAWAVGVDTSGSFPQETWTTVIEHWNGSTWTLVRSPNVDEINRLNGVAIIDPNDAWAVGYSEAGFTGKARTLVEHWDGKAWAAVPSGNIGARSNVLDDVSGVSPGHVWAVGYRLASGGNNLALIEQWDGTSWKPVPSPVAGTGSFLLSVTALTPTDVRAVGFTARLQRALVLHWNGDEWALEQIPIAAGLSAVRGLSPTDIWAVGFGEGHCLVEHWDGRQWSIVPVP